MNKFKLFTLCAVLMMTGCVERSLEIRSEPEGAKVYLDSNFVGVTPLTVPFTYYGNHSIRLEKEGYVTLVGNVRLSSPWFDKPGIDFVSENLLPVTVFNRHSAVFSLVKAGRVDADTAIERARDYSKGFSDFRDNATNDKQGE